MTIKALNIKISQKLGKTEKVIVKKFISENDRFEQIFKRKSLSS